MDRALFLLHSQLFVDYLPHETLPPSVRLQPNPQEVRVKELLAHADEVNRNRHCLSIA